MKGDESLLLTDLLPISTGIIYSVLCRARIYCTKINKNTRKLTIIQYFGNSFSLTMLADGDIMQLYLWRIVQFHAASITEK